MSEQRVQNASFLLGREAWMDSGTCHVEHADRSIFILEHGHTAREAKTYCDRCPVLFDCRQYARKTGSVGVWGGKVFTFKPETPDYSPAPVLDQRPVIRTVVYFEPGQAPGILGNVASFQKPGIFG